MNIGILKEDLIKEWRVAITPAGAQSLIECGHNVFVEKDASSMCRFVDEDYERVGAKIVYSPDEVIGRSDIILKIAPMTEDQLNKVEDSKIVFAFWHLEVAGKSIVEKILNKKVNTIGYELIEDGDGNHPVLEVSSEIAGQLAIPIAQKCLQSNNNGRGILLGGIPGVPPAAVVILGAGVVGRAAVRNALGVGAHVSVLDTDIKQLKKLTEMYQGRITTAIANQYNLERGLKYADVFISAVRIGASRTPHLITEEMVKSMKVASVIIDISIDQGGVCETSRPTTSMDPIYIKHGVLHHCVPNMPSAVARTATYGLTNAALPYIEAVADEGIHEAMENIPGLMNGVCTLNGKIIKETLRTLYKI